MNLINKFLAAIIICNVLALQVVQAAPKTEAEQKPAHVHRTWREKHAYWAGRRDETHNRKQRKYEREEEKKEYARGRNDVMKERKDKAMKSDKNKSDKEAQSKQSSRHHKKETKNTPAQQRNAYQPVVIEEFEELYS